MAPARPASNYLFTMRDKTISKAGESAGAPRPRCRILVAEDDGGLRGLIAEVLERSGCQVDTAEDGAAAWETLKLNRYDLLVTDNHMPGVSGIELLKKLQAAGVRLPVIMATGELPEGEFNQFPGLRPVALLIKPYTIMELLGTVKKVLRQADDADDGSQLFRYRDWEDNEILPAGKAAGAPRPTSMNPPPRILVVDDDNDTRQLSVDVLAGFGYEVEAVIDGAAGWEALQDASFDLIVTDNKMPRMTGIEMIEKLRSAHLTIPVIMATGQLPMNEFARKPWLEPDAMLQRPFSNDELLVAVKNVLPPEKPWR